MAGRINYGKYIIGENGIGYTLGEDKMYYLDLKLLECKYLYSNGEQIIESLESHYFVRLS